METPSPLPTPLTDPASAPVGDVHRLGAGSRQLLRHIANGMLLYAIFYGAVWILAVKVGVLAQSAFLSRIIPTGKLPEALSSALIDITLPFFISAIAAFLAHTGLRLLLRAVRRRLSTAEYTASMVFLGTVTLLALFDGLDPLFAVSSADAPFAISIILGAWCGAALRRRLAL